MVIVCSLYNRLSADLVHSKRLGQRESINFAIKNLIITAVSPVFKYVNLLTIRKSRQPEVAVTCKS